MTKRIDELVGLICGGEGHPLAPILRGWCESSRPWLAFAEAHAAKIRKKVRHASSGEDLGDLIAELAVAALLVRDRRFSVAYEPHRATGERGPDFGVTFRAHIPFFVEVARLRLPGGTGDDLAALRLARVVGDKIEQLPPGAANLLAVALPPGAAGDDLMPAALRRLDGPPGQEEGSPFPGVRAYARGRHRLSAVALCSLTPGGQLVDVRLWLHPQARHPLHPEVARYLARVPGSG
ncbi:hypothetical protein DAETH_10920 [Deinococcus aetherius]|uniref:Uncharacterized protein n=1 Tax=Deinococcus aetherius TaxID=200252 RepID=A0ABM8ABH9_9DEIO|nr:hypothetical protein [Deinococcus aetherius]BDP41123.1 hypothetical protein DAETH_10920 [Deinococcus aetherius]